MPLQYALKPDFAVVHAYEGDTDGNLRYRKTARSFNPVMAMAAKKYLSSRWKT